MVYLYIMRRFFIVFFIILIPLFCNECLASMILDNTTVVNYSELGNESIDDLPIYSDCVLMVERYTGDVLYQKNAHERMYPASTTKMLTAILVLENCDLNEIATVSASAVKAVPATYSTADLVIR